jgi:hypothetical protein
LIVKIKALWRVRIDVEHGHADVSCGGTVDAEVVEEVVRAVAVAVGNAVAPSATVAAASAMVSPEITAH